VELPPPRCRGVATVDRLPLRMLYSTPKDTGRMPVPHWEPGRQTSNIQLRLASRAGIQLRKQTGRMPVPPWKRGKQTSNIERRTLNIEFQLSCEQHQTPDRERGRGRGRIRKQGPAEAGTPNIEHSTSNSRTRTSRLRCTTPRQGTRRKGNAQLRMETGRMPVLLWKLAEAGTPNIEHRTSNIEHRTPNIGHAEAWTPNAQPSTLPPPARPRSKAGNPQPT
jgi:hypothetical protein